MKNSQLNTLPLLKHFKPMISGCLMYNLGTASALRVDGITVCRKTGTAENYAKIGGMRVKWKIILSL
jgi:penicillin-binding protein 2